MFVTMVVFVNTNKLSFAYVIKRLNTNSLSSLCHSSGRRRLPQPAAGSQRMPGLVFAEGRRGVRERFCDLVEHMPSGTAILDRLPPGLEIGRFFKII